MNRSIVGLVWVLAILGLSAWAQGELVFYDSFDGGAGPLDGRSAEIGGLWDDVAGGVWEVKTDGFFYNGLTSTGGRVEAQLGGNTSHSAINSDNPAMENLFASAGTFYFSMLFRDDGTGPPAGSDSNGGHGSIVFKTSNSTGYVAPIEDNDGNGQSLRLPEVHSVTGPEARNQLTSESLGLHDGEVHMLAMQIVNDGGTGPDEVNVVLDPDLLVLGDQEPDWASGFMITNLDITDTGYDTVNLTGSRLDPTTPFASYDEIRVGTTWEDVVGGTFIPPVDFTWNVDASGDWTRRSNWGSGVPGVDDTVYANHTVTFGPIISSRSTVFTNSDVSVRAITFDSSESYNVSGHGTISLVQGTATGAPTQSSITVAEGSHQFQAPVSLQNDTSADVASEATLTFNNALNLNNNSLTKIGDGTLAINNSLGSGGGTVNCDAGTCTGIGTVGGDLNNRGGTISPGNSAGSLSVVPEPAAWLLLTLGMVGCLGLRRR